MKKDYIIVGGGVIIAILLIWISLGIVDKNKILEENKELKRDRLKLVQEYLKVAKEIPSEIKSQIQKLVIEYEDLAPDIAKELLEVLNLIEQKMEPKAIATLAKIIEVQLKEKFSRGILKGKYSNEEEFHEKKRGISFYKAIEFAKSEKFLSEHEYSLANLLREYRNRSSHELGVKFSKNWQTIAFLTGIEIVFKLKGKKAA